MTKIRTHRFENEMWGRAHLPFFKKLDEYLSNFFDVESINYNVDGNTFNGRINLLKPVGNFGNTPPLSDVECVLENLETGEIKLLSFTEYFNSYSCHIAKSETCSKVLLAHFNWGNVYYWMKRENSINMLNKIKPWIFLPFQEFDVDYYRNERTKITEFDDKLFWMGSGVDTYRKMIRMVENKGHLQPIVSTSHEEYLNRLIKSKIGLSYYLDLDKYNTPFDHPGEFCYRDIEYTLLGIPYIRIEFKDNVYDEFKPNCHYISIPREHAYVAYEKYGDEGICDLYIKRYKEVINDTEFLNYISKNQLEWCEKNLNKDKKYELTFNLLELKNWK
jgi:hypothetical protein